MLILKNNIDIKKYKTLVFDCDGVILNSNKVKTEAFYQSALPYGEAAAQALVDYHVSHGGISRYKKFAFFLEEVVPIHAQGIHGPNLNHLLESYANFVKEGLLTCEVANGLHELRNSSPDTNWLIVSGGDQSELREIFSARSLDCLFDGGILAAQILKMKFLHVKLLEGIFKLLHCFLVIVNTITKLLLMRN